MVRAVQEGPSALGLVLAAGVLANDAQAHVEDGALVTVGDPTETALLHAAHEAGLDVPGLRAALAASGLETVRARHTCAHRVDELLTIVTALRAVPAETAA